MPPPEIRNPQRLLFLGPPDSGVLTLLKDLTGSAPEPRTLPPHSRPSSSNAPADATSSPAANPAADPTETPPPTPTPTTTTAGTTHALHLSTRYYTATIPIWLDEAASPSDWRTDFQLPEAREVVAAIGAYVVVFRRRRATSSSIVAEGGAWDADKAVALMKAVKDVVERHAPGFEGVMMVVGMPGGDRSRGEAKNAGQKEKGRKTRAVEEEMVVLGGERLTAEQWEDECFDLGFEYVDGGVREEGKEREKKGVERLREALETCDWEEVEGDDDEVDFAAFEEGEGDDGEDAGFAVERRQVEREFAGLQMEMADGRGGGEGWDEAGEEQEEDMQVEELERMMVKMSAVRDMSAHMDEKERKKLAARTVNEMMRNL